MAEHSGYRNIMYIRNLYLLAFFRKRIVVMNHSRRILNLVEGNGQTMFSGSIEQIADQASISLGPLISPGCWLDESSAADLREEMQDIDIEGTQSPERKFEFGAIGLIQGNQLDAARGFEACAAWLASYSPPDDLSESGHDILRQLRLYMSLYRSSPGQLKARLLQAVSENAAALGFVQSPADKTSSPA